MALSYNCNPDVPPVVVNNLAMFVLSSCRMFKSTEEPFKTKEPLTVVNPSIVVAPIKD